jgi:phosphomannomutase
MNTMGEAILDFCTQYSPAAIDVTGDDMDPDRARQKTRIYANLLRQNASRLAAAGYDVLQTGRKLEIVRNTRFDSTGIDTPDNPNM